MDIKKLETALKPWLAPETWHTGHPSDKKRFHKALLAAFQEMGTGISSDDFREAIENVLAEKHPGHLRLTNAIEQHTELAENIASYAYDIQR